MYDWRKMTKHEQSKTMEFRKQKQYPYHSPPHLLTPGTYLISAANYEHQPILGQSHQRLLTFEANLITTLSQHCQDIFAWCVLKNHYHLLISTKDMRSLLISLGQLHGKTSHQWNLEDRMTSRKCWCHSHDRKIRSHRHQMVSMNYIHHNPVHHNYCLNWNDWPFSSAHHFLKNTDRAEAIRIWREYPLLEYGRKWDP